MRQLNETTGEVNPKTLRLDPQITGNVGLYYCCYPARGATGSLR